MDENEASRAGNNSELPPNPKTGECYARVYISPVFETSEREVVINEALQKKLKSFLPVTKKLLSA
jgi:hypothetical protein